MVVRNSNLQGGPKTVCTRPRCGKKYVDEASLANHIADHDGKIVHPVCAYCGKTFANTSSLQLHIRNTCQSVPTEESPKKRKKKSKELEVALHRSDCISIHYSNGHYSNECCTVTGTNTCNGASFITIMPLR